MPNWLDIVSLVVTVGVFGGVVYAVVYVSNRISQGVQATKAKLKEQGLHISDKGVSIKTSKRFDREDYVDATQRGFVKAMEASSFGSSNNNNRSNSSLKPPSLQHADSTSSVSSTDEKKKSLFGRKKKDQ